RVQLGDLEDGHPQGVLGRSPPPTPRRTVRLQRLLAGDPLVASVVVCVVVCVVVSMMVVPVRMMVPVVSHDPIPPN
ncbi:hypothetical protein, partial [Streptomyces sp. NPDC002690]